MTSRIYYTEAYRTLFEATVTACDTVDGRYHVTLDRTAFYPTSGGQPFDTGTLGGAAVTDVIDREDGEIAHVVAAPLATGAVVSGAIDWARRFEHMQQHTGQHVLSAAFDRLFQARTESFHMGAAAATIDLAREVTPRQIAEAESEANRVVWEDRPVAIRFASPEEAAAMPLRKEPARTGPLRLVDVEGFDLSACGGTHVARTGGVGIIAVGGWEKFRQGTRVEFLCGGRALARFRLWRDSLAATQKFLSVAPDEIAAAVERMQADSKAQQRSPARPAGPARRARGQGARGPGPARGRPTGDCGGDRRVGRPGPEGHGRGRHGGRAGRRGCAVHHVHAGAGRDRARRRRWHRCRRGAEGAHGAVRGKGWRKVRSRAGRGT